MAAPARRMKAGTSTLRTTVASMRIASAVPTPKSCRKESLEVPNAKKVTDIKAAAVEMMRPERARP